MCLMQPSYQRGAFRKKSYSTDLKSELGTVEKEECGAATPWAEVNSGVRWKG